MGRSSARWRALVRELSVSLHGCHRCWCRLAFVLLSLVRFRHSSSSHSASAENEAVRHLARFRDSYERVFGRSARGNPFSLRSHGSLLVGFERRQRLFGSATDQTSALARE